LLEEGLLECYAVWFGRLAPAVWGEHGASVSGVEESLSGKSGTWCRERGLTPEV